MTEHEQLAILKSWLDEHRALIFRIVRAYAFSEDDRDDLFQEITLQIWRSIPNFKAQCAVTTWLYRISLNISIRHAKKERKHVEGRERTGYDNLLIIADHTTDERLEWLYEEISKLDEIDRSITLLMFDGYSYKEISDITGLSESNIGVKINRLKKHLTSKIKP